MSHNASDIDLALEQALAAGEGEATMLHREEVDVYIFGANPVGDVVANADPVHVGLPWAGIRLLLQAAVSEANQMTSLLVGWEIALYMANRLKAYIEFLHQLPATLTRTNFKTAVTELYAHILGFLARAIRIYQTSTSYRALRAFWTKGDIVDFEKTCNELGVRVEIEASNCDRTLDAQDRKGIGKFKQDLQRVLKELKQSHRLQESLDRLETKIDLDKLPYAKGAIKSIFWLRGWAGIGKSTISRTVAEWVASQGGLGGIDLGASFFFKRGEGDRGSASRFFPTITRELVLKIPGLDAFIAEVITKDPLTFNKALGKQFNKLIHQPLHQVKFISNDSSTFIVVVDALDECEKERDVRDRVLQDAVPHTTIRHDISTFLKDAFEEIRNSYNLTNLLRTPLDRDWPGNKRLQALVDMAVPLFIVAATVHRFVGDSNWDPRERLGKILQFPGIGKLEQMAQTYLPVLTQLSAPSKNSHDKDELHQEFRIIVGSIVSLAEPLSRQSLAVLLNISPDTIALRLRPLHSVLRIPTDSDIPIRTLHLSFNEFLLSDQLQLEPFGVNSQATHRMLLSKYLQLLSGPGGLQENLCKLEYPGKPRRDIDQTTINNRLSSAFQYACRYWIQHIEHGKVEIYNQDNVHVFLQKHFLHWLEAISLINRLAEVIEQIRVLQSLVSDAQRIVLADQHFIDLAPLQVYSSAIVFAPQTSIVRNVYGRIQSWIQRFPITPPTWSLELQKLEGHTSSVHAVVFSQDGSLLASALYNYTIRLWNPTTGQELQKLEGHTGWAHAVVFSQDGSLLASASDDYTIRL
ncbi:MAG: hypothetical protein Q9213_007520 [Squamulea squamosa]